MTTIAYRDGVLAGDTRVTEEDGTILTDNQPKVFKLADGSLFGASGESEQGDLLYAAAQEAAKAGRARSMTFPEFAKEPDVYAVLIEPDGAILLTEGQIWAPWPDKFIAIGSGHHCALSALRLGHSAVEAVQAGIAGSCFSGGRVTMVTLDKVFA